MSNSNGRFSHLPPFQQGGLDSLCGLYSIVNAERVINHSSDEQAQVLFEDMVHFLSRKRLLPRVLLDGVIHSHIVLILEKVVNGRIPNIELPWRSQPTPDLDAFWQSMLDFLDGTPGRAIILGLNGFHDHWTVIKSITSKSIFLFDSAEIPRLPRSQCSTARRRRKHLLLPAQTYFLSKDLPRAA
jgi:hypothetical protein